MASTSSPPPSPVSASSSAVSLRVYDLSRGMARQLSPALLGKQIDGIWHTGVLVYGKEYFYGGGIQAMAPELVVARYGMPPVQVVPLGATSVPQARFERFLRDISPRFTAATYDLLVHNCNHFSDELARFLLGSGIPQHILDLPNEVLTTPLGAMLRPMIENLQREMNATGAQPFAIPFNDPVLASADTAPISMAAAPTTSSSNNSTSDASTGATPLRSKVSGQPALHLARIVARICELNAHTNPPVLSSEQLQALRTLASRVADSASFAPAQSPEESEHELELVLWQTLDVLLACGRMSPFFFPALGVFRVLLLHWRQRVTSVEVTPAVLRLTHACVDVALDVAERDGAQLPRAHAVALLAVLINGFAHPAASERVLARAAQLLPFAFAAIADARDASVRVLGASLVGNCCLAVRIEEEVVITTAICGATETLDRLSRELLQSQEQTQAVTSGAAQQTVASVVAGVASLLRNFAAARSLSVELGLPDVLRRLRASAGLGAIQPLLSELVALV